MNKYMKLIILSITIILVVVLFCGCEIKHKGEQSSNGTTINTTVEKTIYNTSLEDNIKKYCEMYLSSDKNHAKSIETIKDIVTTSYYERQKNIENYLLPDPDFQGSTSLSKVYYDTIVENTKKIEVAALCNESLIFNDQTSSYTTFYIFDMEYINDTWLINDVRKSDV